MRRRSREKGKGPEAQRAKGPKYGESDISQAHNGYDCFATTIILLCVSGFLANSKVYSIALLVTFTCYC